jgi:SAM-dependent methyltransferase
MTRPARASARRFPIYSRYADVYDLIGQRSFGEQIAEATLAYLADIGELPTRAVDLACGTGAATQVFARAGIAIEGIDLSPEMLSVAKASAERAGVAIDWRHQDIRGFSTDVPADLITCFYDALNYLVEDEDLALVFARSFEALRPGGRFIFDLNTREKFQTAWNMSTFVAVDREDLFGVYQSWYEESTGLSPLVLTFFVRDDLGQWDRFDEEHVERAYDLAEVHAMLVETGFSPPVMLDYADRSLRFGGFGSERSHRVVFIAERPVAGDDQP